MYNGSRLKSGVKPAYDEYRLSRKITYHDDYSSLSVQLSLVN